MTDNPGTLVLLNVVSWRQAHNEQRQILHKLQAPERRGPGAQGRHQAECRGLQEEDQVQASQVLHHCFGMAE